MMVAAGGKEQRSGTPAPAHLVESERGMVEGRGAADVADVEMDVPDHRRGGEPEPWLRSRGGHELVVGERLARSQDLAVADQPFGPRPVAVDLDAQSVRIHEVGGLAVSMVRRADVEAGPVGVAEEATQVAPGGQPHREMIKAQEPAPR